MAITLDATVGGASSNTYATLAEANTYHDAHVYYENWTNASTDKKNRALAMATRLLDDNVRWTGSVVNDTQALRWPRNGTYDADGILQGSDAIPQDVKDATAEYARHLIQSDLTATPDTQGFKEMKVGELELVVDPADRDRIGLMPEVVRKMIEHLGTVKSQVGFQARVIRT